jgi:hypothetical protein
VIGSLALTVVSLAAAEVARPVRYFDIPLGAALIVAPFVFGSSTGTSIVSILGAALIVLSTRRGCIRERYGNWNLAIT